MGESFQIHEGGLAEFLGKGAGRGGIEETPDQAVRRSAATLQRLRDRAGPLLLVHLPIVTEMTQGALRPGPAQRVGEASGMDVRFLAENPLLKGRSEAETLSWSNLPHDSHLSTKGVEVYGKAFAEEVVTAWRNLRSRQPF